MYEYPQFPQQEIRSIFMVSFRLQSIICKGVIGQNADIHFILSKYMETFNKPL